MAEPHTASPHPVTIGCPIERAPPHGMSMPLSAPSSAASSSTIPNSTPLLQPLDTDFHAQRAVAATARDWWREPTAWIDAEGRLRLDSRRAARRKQRKAKRRARRVASSGGQIAAAVAAPASVITKALDNHFAQDIAPFLLEHPAVWRPKGHFGECGQNCGCCRSHNPEDAAEGCNCQCCFTGWELSSVSTSIRRGLRTYITRWQDRQFSPSPLDKWNGCKGWNGWTEWNDWDWWNKWNW